MPKNKPLKVGEHAPSSSDATAGRRPGQNRHREDAALAEGGASLINDTTLALVNRLLVGASPVGAYAIGMVCAAVWAVDPSLEIPDTALAGARESRTLEEGLRYANDGRWWALAKARGAL